MQLEFHQLDRRWEHLRVREPHRQRRLLASLAESGQQTPIIVVVSPDHRERYLVIDGYKRVAELEQRLGYSLEELARRLDRSLSWVSRRLALGPEGAPRVDAEHCQRMAAAFAAHHCDTRQAGQLYTAWRQGSRVARDDFLLGETEPDGE